MIWKPTFTNVGKNAVNAILTNAALMELMPATFHMHTREGWMNLLRVTASAVLTREVMVYVPKLLKWSQSTNGNGGSDAQKSQ